MGESKNSYFRVQFNSKLKVGFKGAEVTSDGGLLAIREMDEQLKLTEIAGEYLKDRYNPSKLDEIIMKWIERIDSFRGINKIVLDMDSSGLIPIL